MKIYQMCLLFEQDMIAFDYKDHKVTFLPPVNLDTSVCVFFCLFFNINTARQLPLPTLLFPFPSPEGQSKPRRGLEMVFLLSVPPVTLKLMELDK